MPIIVTTPPAAEPITLREARVQLRLDDDERGEDALITRNIIAARRWVENYIKRKLITQSLTWYGKSLSGIIELAPNLQSITSIKYLDSDGVQQTLNSDNYRADIRALVGTVSPSYGMTWPVVRNVSNSVEIEFVVGYGNSDAVPEEIKNAMLLKITDYHLNREETIIGVSVTKTDEVKNLLSEYRVKTFQ